MIRRLFYILTCFFVYQAQAQYNNLNFTHYNSQNGLASDHVDHIMQDREGYMWFATNQGVSVFDGLHFSTFHHDPNNKNSIGGNHVFDIKEDKDGSLWMAIENFGLSKIDKYRNEIFNYEIPFTSEVEERYINTFFFEKNGTVLVATERGLLLFDPEKKTFRSLLPPVGGKQIDVIGIESDRFDNCWIFGYEGELFCRFRGSSSFQYIDAKRSTGFVSEVYHSPQDEFWLSSAAGLYKLIPASKASSIQFKMNSHFGPIQDADRLFIDGVGTHWIVDKKNRSLLFFPWKNKVQELDEAWVPGLDLGLTAWKKNFIDKDGNVWISTDRGVYMFDKHKNQISTYGELSRYNMRNSFGTIFSMDQFEKDIVTITSTSLIVFDKADNKINYVAKSPILGYTDLSFNCIQRIDKNIWWVATNHGIWELIEKNDHFTFMPSWLAKTKYSFAQGEVLWISVDAAGIIYMSTYKDGLILFDPRKKTFTPVLSASHGRYNMSLKHVDFTEIASDGSVGARTHYGFAVAPKGSLMFVPAQAFCDSVFDWSLPEITDLQELNGKWWASTQGNGLWSLDPATHHLTIYTKADGLPSNYISSILENKGKLVLGTSSGMSIFDPESKMVTNYFASDGLPSDQFTVRSRYKSPNGEFFFSTTNGLISFYLDSLHKKASRPLIKLSSVLLQGVSFTREQLSDFIKKKSISISYSESIVFSFTPLTFTGQSDYVVRYRLNENDVWREGQSGLLVSLDNLDADLYNMQVQLIDKKGNLMSDVMIISLDVVPPFWRRPLFILLLSVLVLFISIYFVNWRAKQKALQEQQKFESINLIERERTRIAMELHDDIGGNLTAVHLMTSMLEDADLNSREKSLVKNISEASNHMVDDMNEIVWALNASHDSMQQMIAYIREHAQEFFRHTTVELDFHQEGNVPEMQVVSRVRRNIFLIYKESVHNILKHSSANKVDIRVVVNKRQMIMTIQDNGEPLATPIVGRSTGNGLGNMRMRAKEIGGQLEIIKENGHTVRFSMPINRLLYFK